MNTSTLKFFSITFLVVVGIGLWFYWYSWRPSQIMKNCSISATKMAVESLKDKVAIGAIPFGQEPTYKQAAEKGLFLKDDYDYKYKICLQGHGI